MKSFGSFVFDYQYPAYDGVNGIKNDKAAQDLQKEGIQFDYEIGGLQFRAVCWTEFEEYVTLSSSLSAMRMMTTKSS